jgi:hypothetical protein
MRAPASTSKKVVVQLLDQRVLKGYLNPTRLGEAVKIDMLTTEGEHKEIELAEVKCVYFVREFQQAFEPERKTFLSRPKLGGLWVRVRFRDEDEMEGIVANDLLEMLNSGVKLTPPDLHGNSLRVFIPRSALSELRVLGVVGVAKRGPKAVKPERAAISGQTELFGE